MLNTRTSERISASVEAMRVLTNLQQCFGTEMSAPARSAIGLAAEELHREIRTFYRLGSYGSPEVQTESVSAPTVL